MSIGVSRFFNLFIPFRYCATNEGACRPPPAPLPVLLPSATATLWLILYAGSIVAARQSKQRAHVLARDLTIAAARLFGDLQSLLLPRPLLSLHFLPLSS